MAVDLNSLSPTALKAAMTGGTRNWGRHGSSLSHVRYAEPIVGRKGRRKCHCGCGKRSTHTGRANGMALMSGCADYVAQWVVDPHRDMRIQGEQQLREASLETLQRVTRNAMKMADMFAPMRRELIKAEWVRRGLTYFPTPNPDKGE